MSFVPGQRWVSSAEPELGLGTVLRVEGRHVQFVFTGSGMLRHYAAQSAPLIRAAFRVGEKIRVDGRDLTVDRVEEANGLVQYGCANRTIPEGQLDPQQPLSQADTRLMAGKVDRSSQFELRRECLQRRAEARSHSGWGVLGSRIDLIPHQLRVAQTAAHRRPVRLLLADEVGLGKTIEASLVAAQLLASGRAARCLILTPDSLVNQWYIELLRRFNLSFAIYDEERCESLDQNASDRNPFDDEQLVIASIDWMSSHAKRCAQAIDGKWDILIVDEAHHLHWDKSSQSAEYDLIEALAARTANVLLLTATPEQLGHGAHFARLRLLDPERFSNLESFLQDEARFVALGQLAEKISSGEALSIGDIEQLHQLFAGESEWLKRCLDSIESSGTQQELVAAMIDRHGTGRVMVRNRRASIGGFPKRILHTQELSSADETALLGRLRAEFCFDAGLHNDEPAHDYVRDPRTDWLLHILDELGSAKVLVLCSTRNKVQALEEALRMRSGIAAARFHEDMNLLQRDRNAAYFADPEGARILLSSEIGAEGRNFQFAQHVIMWDLPCLPDMLEQRIGRLDRIGQSGDVHIFCAAVDNSPQAVLMQWYQKGLNAFIAPPVAGRALMKEFGSDLLQLAQSAAEENSEALDALISMTLSRNARLTEEFMRGRDRLLEMASRFGAEHSSLLLDLQETDRLAAEDDYVFRLLESFGVQNESLGHRISLLDPEHLIIDGFEELKSGPRLATLDRATALSREEVLYLRQDHPMIMSAQDMLLSSDQGNSAFLVDEELPPRTAILEALFVIECVAPPHLDAERFLPITPFSVAVDSRMKTREQYTPSERARIRTGDRQFDLSSLRKILAGLIPPMMEHNRQTAQTACEQLIQVAISHADRKLTDEIERLQTLAKVNPAVRPEEIERLQHERQQLLDALPGARARLESLRLVASSDFLSLRR